MSANRIEKLGERQQPQRLERAAFDRQRRENRLEIVGRVQRERRVGVQILDAFGRGASSWATRCGSVCGSSSARRAAPSGVSANPRTTLDDLIPFQCAKVHLVCIVLRSSRDG